jgi:hypothetical protein
MYWKGEVLMENTAFHPVIFKDFDTIDWVELARQLGVRIPGQYVDVELTKLETPYQQYKLAVTLLGYLIQNNLPIDFLDDQLEMMQSYNPITSFDRACVKLYAKRELKKH